jgi:hypothetical protein
LRDLVGTPELVPKNVICTAFFNFPFAQYTPVLLGVTQMSQQKLVVGCGSASSPTASDCINPVNKQIFDI